MKRILSVLLAVCILFSLSASAFAANVTQTGATMSVAADKTTVNPGDTITVTYSLDQTVEGVTTMGYKLYFDDALFTMTASTNTDNWTVSKKGSDATGTFYRVSFQDKDTVGLPMNVGKVATLTFTAESVTEASTATFTLVSEKGANADFEQIDTYVSDPFTVTVTPAGGSENPDPSEGYVVTVNGPTEKVTVDDDVEVTLEVNKAYATYDIDVSYDSSKLTYKSISTTGVRVIEGNGTLSFIQADQDSKDTTADIVLTFKAAADGSAEVSVTSAAFDSIENSDSNMSVATIKNSPVTIEIGKKQHSVDLPDFFEGDKTVEDGADYKFSAKDTEHYDYTDVKATVDGEDLTVEDDGNGNYTVKNVTGDLTITGKQTPKQYNVSKAGTGAADVTLSGEKATYGTDYTFTVTQDDTYNYTMTVTIKGAEKQPTLVSSGNGTYNYKIEGANIDGDIVITVDKTQKPAQTTTIIFEGSGSGDVIGGTPQTATNGQDFKFEIDKKTGYTYTVKLGDEILNPGADGKYTIPGEKITGETLTVTVEKTAGIEIKVNQYLKLDNKAMFLVTATSDALADGQVLNYGENAMYWSNNYNAYAYLVISDKSLDEVTAEANEKVAIQTGTKTTVEKTTDVNGSGKLDANDAQLVYNMYNVKYEEFGKITMEMFLRADQNTDREITTQDAVAVIDAIVAAKKG